LSACPDKRCDGSGFLYDEDSRRARPCSCRPARMARKRSAAVAGRLPRRFREVSFDREPVRSMNNALIRDVRAYVRAIGERLDEGRGLWFVGDVGTGKTTLAMLVSKSALDAGRSVAIYSLPRLLSEIRTTFDETNDRTYTSLLDRLAAVDLLHIDDVGAEKTSPWVLEQLYAIVNARYEHERSIVITTNLERDPLAEQITERTVSRLEEMCEVLPLWGRDARRQTA
jgi:DNA replication protein DnaC